MLKFLFLCDRWFKKIEHKCACLNPAIFDFAFMIYYEYFEHYKLLIVRLEGEITVRDFIGIISTVAKEFEQCKLDFILSDFRKAFFKFDTKGVGDILQHRAKKSSFKPKYMSVFLVDDIKQTTYTTLYNHFTQAQNLKLQIKVCVTIAKATSLLGLMINPSELELMIKNLTKTFTPQEQVRV